MTLREFSLVLEAREQREEAMDMRATFGGWLSASLQRAKRIPSFSIFWNQLRTGDKGRALPPDEAAREKARHAALIEKLAPGLAFVKPSKESTGGS